MNKKTALQNLTAAIKSQDFQACKKALMALEQWNIKTNTDHVLQGEKMSNDNRLLVKYILETNRSKTYFCLTVYTAANSGFKHDIEFICKRFFDVTEKARFICTI